MVAVSVVTLSYQDLVDFNSSSTTTAKNDELVQKIGRAFGANTDCLGILAVEGIPDFEEQRQALLPLAQLLPGLSDLAACESPESFYSTGWSHGREQLAPGKPDLSKGSYYSNPLVEDLVPALSARTGHTIEYWKNEAVQNPSFYAPNIWPASLPALQPACNSMGKTVQRTGCLLAAVCDEYCKRRGVPTSLKKTLTESLNAKARLLHYFDASTNVATDNKKDDGQMWCGWHNDHGSLTGLVPAIYMDGNGKQVPSPDPAAGLYIQARSGEQVQVRLPANACGFQIGETSQIQSGGLLQATPHAVMPAKAAGVTRETFAVFLEPEFDAPLAIPAGKTVSDCQADTAKLPPTVLPVNARWRVGQTFGDFHNATVQAFTTETAVQ